ncbi:Spy/CpxP family protein refolding chaperone [Nannocystaceae bacterium ST9]
MQVPAFLIPAFAIATSLLLSGDALAEGKGGHGRLAKVCEHIECSEQQDRDIRQVFEQMRIDVKPDRDAIRELRDQIAAEWVKDQPDEAKLAKLADKLAKHERNIADRHHEAMMELHDLLDAAQREQVVAMMAERGHDHEGKGDKPKAKKGDKANKAKKRAGE